MVRSQWDFEWLDTARGHLVVGLAGFEPKTPWKVLSRFTRVPDGSGTGGFPCGDREPGGSLVPILAGRWGLVTGV